AALPQNIDDYWFAPRNAERVGVKGSVLAEAAAAYEAGNYAASLTYARQAAAAGGPLAPYARLYIAQSLLRQSNAAEAEKAFATILDGNPEGHLSVAAAIGRAEALDMRGDHAAAADMYEKLATHKSVSPEDVLWRLARAAHAAACRARRGPTGSAPRPAPRRADGLRPRGDSRPRRPPRGRPPRARARRRVPRQHVVERGAQQPRHALHPRQRGRPCGADVQ